MIVGRDIITRGLIKNGKERNLKHSTFDLTIGEIVPTGKEGIQARRKQGGIKNYIIEPREMVWILSAEEFSMPKDVTGIATLRTSFTQKGILALNVGIVDPFFEGPISTALLNFSDARCEIKVGDSFFRVIFVEHADVSEFHRKNESRDFKEYIENLENQSLRELFPQNFLNIPKLDASFFSNILFDIIWSWIKLHPKTSVISAIIVSSIIYYIFQDGYGEMLSKIVISIKEFIEKWKIG